MPRRYLRRSVRRRVAPGRFWEGCRPPRADRHYLL